MLNIFFLKSYLKINLRIYDIQIMFLNRNVYSYMNIVIYYIYSNVNIQAQLWILKFF